MLAYRRSANATGSTMETTAVWCPSLAGYCRGVKNMGSINSGYAYYGVIAEAAINIAIMVGDINRKVPVFALLVGVAWMRAGGFCMLQVVVELMREWSTKASGNKEYQQK